MRTVKCRSGLTGWQERLRKVYMDFDHFARYDEVYGLANRLGFVNASNAWKSNPIVQGSSNPSDYRRVRENKSK